MLSYKRDQNQITYTYTGDAPVRYSISWGTFDPYGNRLEGNVKSTDVFSTEQSVVFDQLSPNELYWFTGTFTDEAGHTTESVNHEIRTLSDISITKFEPIQETDHIRFTVGTSVPAQVFVFRDNVQVVYVDTNELSERTFTVSNLTSGTPYEFRLVFKTSDFRIQEVAYTIPSRKFKEVLMENKVYKYMNMAIDMYALDYDQNNEEDYARGMVEYLRKFRESLVYRLMTGQMPGVGEMELTMLVDIVIGLAVVARGSSENLTKMIANWFKYDNSERLGPGLPKFTMEQKNYMLTAISDVVRQTVYEFKVKEIAERIELLNDMGVIADSSPYRPFYEGITGKPLAPSGVFNILEAVDNEIRQNELVRQFGSDSFDLSYDLISPRYFLPPSGDPAPSGYETPAQ